MQQENTFPNNLDPLPVPSWCEFFQTRSIHKQNKSPYTLKMQPKLKVEQFTYTTLHLS